MRQAYPSQDGIPSLFTPNEWSDAKEDVTQEIKAFYEENPFPNYDDFDSAGEPDGQGPEETVCQAARRTDSVSARGSSNAAAARGS